MDPRGSQRMSEVYSPTILKMVRSLVSPPPHPRCHPYVLVVAGAGSSHERACSVCRDTVSRQSRLPRGESTPSREAAADEHPSDRRSCSLCRQSDWQGLATLLGVGASRCPNFSNSSKSRVLVPLRGDYSLSVIRTPPSGTLRPRTSGETCSRNRIRL
jgi:hypothetical protein